MVTGMVAGHEPASFYRWFEGIVAEALAVPVDFHRALPPGQIRDELQRFVPKVRAVGSASDGVCAALEAAGADDVILITGSFYLVGEVGRVLAGL